MNNGNTRAERRRKTRMLVYGDAGSGKSEFAADVIRSLYRDEGLPGLVLMFDAYGKDEPYRKLGAEQEPFQYEDGTWTDDIVDSSGALICRIENYSEPDPQHPTAYERFLVRMADFTPEERAQYSSLVVDSCTSMDLAAFYWSVYKINRKAKDGGDMDGRKHYGFSKERLQEMLLSRVVNFRELTIVAIAHIDEDKDEVNMSMVRNPKFPGKLRNLAASQYTEVFHAYRSKHPKDGAQFWLQTETGGGYNAFHTVTNPSDPCEPRYDKLWAPTPRTAATPTKRGSVTKSREARS